MPLDEFEHGVALVVQQKALKVLFTPSRGERHERIASLPRPCPQTMRGAMLVGPEAIEIRDVPVPRPGPGEMLLKIEAATTCGTDVKVFKRGGHPRMLKAPTLFGHEMAGRVAALGAGVESYRGGGGGGRRQFRAVPCNASRAGAGARTSARTCISERRLRRISARAAPLRGAQRAPHPRRPVVRARGAGGAARLRAARHRRLRDRQIRGARAGGDADLRRRADRAALRRRRWRISGRSRCSPIPIRAGSRRDARIGAARTIEIARGGGQAEAVRAQSESGKGFWIAVDATGVPARLVGRHRVGAAGRARQSLRRLRAGHIDRRSTRISSITASSPSRASTTTAPTPSAALSRCSPIRASRPISCSPA